MNEIPVEREMPAGRRLQRKALLMSELKRERRLFSRGRLALGGGLTLAMALALGLATTVRWGQGPAPASASAAEVLNRAADAALRHAEPRGDQFIYEKFQETTLREKSNGQWGMEKYPVREGWHSVDGYHTGLVRSSSGGETLVCPYGHVDSGEGIGSCRRNTDETVAQRPEVGGSRYADKLLLPTDPGRLLRWVRQTNGRTLPDKHGYDASSLVELLRSTTPARQRATIFRTLAGLKGVTVQRQATDPAGRPGIGLSFDHAGRERIQLVVDRDSYVYLGSREVLLTDVLGLKAGTETAQYTMLATGITDRAGQLPR